MERSNIKNKKMFFFTKRGENQQRFFFDPRLCYSFSQCSYLKEDYFNPVHIAVFLTSWYPLFWLGHFDYFEWILFFFRSLIHMRVIRVSGQTVGKCITGFFLSSSWAALILCGPSILRLDLPYKSTLYYRVINSLKKLGKEVFEINP